MTSSVLHVLSWSDDLDYRLTPLVRATAARGVSVLGVAGPDVDRDACPDLDRTSMTWIDTRPEATARSFRHDVKTLARVFERCSPTAVHIHAGPLAVAAQVAARRSAVGRRVYSAAGIDRQPEGGRANRYANLFGERFVASGVDVVLVSSLEDEDRLVHTLRVPRAKVMMVRRGVDLDRFAPRAATESRIDERSRNELRSRWGSGPDEFVCGVLGAKLAHEVQAAIRSVCRDDSAPTVRCVEFDQANLPSLSARAAFYDAVDVVVVLDGMADGAAVAADRTSGPSTSVLAREIAASAKVAIVGERPGIRLTVEDARTGYVVPPPVVVTAAERIVGFLADPQRRERMALAARAKAVREFDGQREVEGILATYGLGGE